MCSHKQAYIITPDRLSAEGLGPPSVAHPSHAPVQVPGQELEDEVYAALVLEPGVQLDNVGVG